MTVPERSLTAFAQSLSKKGRKCDLSDGCVKAEALKGARIVTDCTSVVKLPKGAWLELTKTEDGKGMLVVWNPARDRKMFAVPLGLIKRVYCPKTFRDRDGKGCRLAPCSSPLSRLLYKGGRIFEVEGTILGGRIHAGFVVNDPESWVAAVMAPEWE